MKFQKGGFTLVELLLVLAIVSLLSTIMYSELSSAREKARIASVKQKVASIQHVNGPGDAHITFGDTPGPVYFKGYQLTFGSQPPYPQTVNDDDIYGKSIDLNGGERTMYATGQPYTSQALSTRSKGTYSFWFYPTGDTARQYIFTQGGDIAYAQPSIRIDKLGSDYGLIVCWYGSTGFPSPNMCARTQRIKNEQWHHVIFTWVANGGTSEVYPNGHYELYVDGELVDEDTGFSLGGQYPPSYLKFGTNNSGGPFYGKVDDFHLYSEPLFEY